MSDDKPQNPPPAGSGPPKGKIQIKLDESVANGVYSNMVLIHSNESEFVLDFCFVQPHQPFAAVRTRVLTSPRHVKRFLATLGKQLDRWEEIHGEIAPVQGGGDEGAYH